jgi:hypothetical protein
MKNIAVEGYEAADIGEQVDKILSHLGLGSAWTGTSRTVWWLRWDYHSVSYGAPTSLPSRSPAMKIAGRGRTAGSGVPTPSLVVRDGYSRSIEARPPF